MVARDIPVATIEPPDPKGRGDDPDSRVKDEGLEPGVQEGTPGEGMPDTGDGVLLGRLDVLGNDATISKVLGRGSTATVYLAEGQKAAFAVKVLREEALLAPTLRERFLREGEILCRARCPGLVTGYATGVYRNRPFLVMEHLPGGSLGRRIGEEGPLPVEDALKTVLDILRALDHLWLSGLIAAHRDIKPGNILFDASGNAKLIDLGVAKTYLHAERAIDTGFLGTVRYMAPEQIEDAFQADIRSDLYSVGAVFFEMLAGRSAFPERKRTEVLADQLSGATPPLPERKDLASFPALAEACAGIVEMSLAADRLSRAQTPSELADAVRRALVLARQGHAGMTGKEEMPPGMRDPEPRGRVRVRRDAEEGAASGGQRAAPDGMRDVAPRGRVRVRQGAASGGQRAAPGENTGAAQSRSLPDILVVAIQLTIISVVCTGVIWGVFEVLEHLW